MKKNAGNKPTTQAPLKENKGGLEYNDFMALLFVGAFLLVDLLNFTEIWENIKPQFLYLTVLNIIAAVYVYFNKDIQSSALVNIFKKQHLFKLYIGFIVISGLSIFGAKNVSLGVVSISEMLVVAATFINFCVLLYGRSQIIYKVAFLVTICAFFQSFIALNGFIEIAKKQTIADALASAVLKGNAANVNIFAASLMFKIPFIFLCIINYVNWKKWISIITLVGAVAAVLLTGARASLLSLITISTLFIIYYFLISTVKKTAVIKLTYILLPIIVAIVVVNFTFKQSKLDARYSSTAERLSTINTSDASVNRRLTFWKASWEMMKDKPLLGIGLGNYRVESIPFDLTTNDSVPLHAHNDFLELAAETGVFNGLLYLSIFIGMLWVNIKRVVKSKDKEVRTIAIVCLMLLVVYGIDALFNFPFYRPTMQICFSLLFTFTLVNVQSIGDTKTEGKSVWIGLVVFAIVPIYFIYYAYKTSNLEYLIQSDNINFSEKGALVGDDVINRGPHIPDVFNTSEPFVEYAGIYYFREKQYDKALKYLDSANKINPYLGRANFYKYLVALQMGNTDSAYSHIKSAFYNRPINETNFKLTSEMAATRKDTSEILKNYKNISSYVKKPDLWAHTLRNLQLAGYNNASLEKFVHQGRIDYPNDSLINKQANSIAITKYLVEGQRLYSIGKNELALKEYNKGLKLEANNIYVLQNIGFYYYNTGKPEQAIPFLIKCTSLPGLNDGKTEFFLGICLVSVGRKNDACKYFNIAKTKGYAQAQDQINLNCK